MLHSIIREFIVLNKQDGCLPNTDFDGSDYYPLTFNDFASSMVTLFTLLMVANWSVILEGYVAATGTWWASVVNE